METIDRLNDFAERLNDLVGNLWYEKLLGLVHKSKVYNVFGELPKLNHCGLVHIIVNDSYVDLCQFKKPYNILRETKERDRNKLIFYEDELGEGSYYIFLELKRLQEDARNRGSRCILSDIEINYDPNSFSRS